MKGLAASQGTRRLCIMTIYELYAKYGLLNSAYIRAFILLRGSLPSSHEAISPACPLRFVHTNRPANLAAAVVQSSTPPASLHNAPGRETGSVLPRGPSYFLLFYVTPALKITSLVLCTTLIPLQKNSTTAIAFLPPAYLHS